MSPSRRSNITIAASLIVLPLAACSGGGGAMALSASTTESSTSDGTAPDTEAAPTGTATESETETAGEACRPGSACTENDGCLIGTCDAAGACENLAPVAAGEVCEFGTCTASGACVEIASNPVLPPTAGDSFSYGAALAINADHFAIASQEGSDTPSVYIVSRDGASWSSSGSVDTGQEVYSLALAGDDLFVGTPFASPGAAGRLHFANGAWTNASLEVPQEFVGNTNTTLGYDMASDGDTLLVSGADDNDLSLVFVYERQGADWAITQTIAPPMMMEETFGSPLLLSGSRAIIGDDFAGEFHLYEQEDNQWAYRASVTRPFSDLGFENDLVAVGDLDDDDQGERAGAVTLLRVVGTEMVEEAKIYAHEPAPGGFFGSSVMLHEGRLFAASEGPISFPGLVHVFEKRQDDWELVHLLSCPDEGFYSDFGDEMAAYEDMFLFSTPYERTAYLWESMFPSP